MQFKTLVVISLIGLLAAVSWPEAKPTGARSSVQILSWQGMDFAAGDRQGTAVSHTGLTLAGTAVTGLFLSPVIPSPMPFNAVVPEWRADVPESASLEILLRTSSNGREWSQWVDVHAHEDWNTPEDTRLAGDMVVVPAAEVTHRYLQFQVSAGRYAGAPPPTLYQLDFVFIDTSDGPTTAELIAQQQEIDAANGVAVPDAPEDFPRPFVVSRAAWCTQPECWHTDLDYETVTHLLVHHTVTSSNGDSAATVRAIWEYHTFTRGWGDIGYNYLVDLNGVIFEGHLNGNYQEWDVVGVHSGNANAGGMAASLIGNFTSPEEGGGTMPSTAMLNAVADLFAWKADQRNIDPYGASRMVDVSWGLPHIMGHRDVYGGLNTLCPGGNAHNYLPWLRTAIASRIGYVSPYIYVDELSGDFTKSNANWYEGPRGCGDNIHSFYTWSTTDPNQSTNWGRWALNVPANGRYRIDVYAPYCDTGAAETVGARYTVNHAYGASTVTVNQDAHVGLWMTVGEFDLAANSTNNLYLTDLTFTDNDRGVWFDAVRLLYLGEAIGQANNIAPAPALWVTTPQVDFSWQIISTAPVIQTQLQAATDMALHNLVFDQTWSGAVLQYTHPFAQDYGQLYWRVTAVTQNMDGSTNTLVSEITSFGLDATPPTSSVVGVYQIPNDPAYILHWQGSDATSGIDGYTIQYRVQGSALWTTWLADTTLTTSRFYPPDEQVYEFRSQAADMAGNMEAPHASADINTHQAILLSHAIMLPFIRR